MNIVENVTNYISERLSEFDIQLLESEIDYNVRYEGILYIEIYILCGDVDTITGLHELFIYIPHDLKSDIIIDTKTYNIYSNQTIYGLKIPNINLFKIKFNKIYDFIDDWIDSIPYGRLYTRLDDDLLQL